MKCSELKLVYAKYINLVNLIYVNVMNFAESQGFVELKIIHPVLYTCYIYLLCTHV